jgi:hypothetical protein
LVGWKDGANRLVIALLEFPDSFSSSIYLIDRPIIFKICPLPLRA